MIVLFIVFGILCALAWARLAAPDVALAEAAVGAGIKGALMLKTWARIRRSLARAPALAALTVASGGAGAALVAAAYRAPPDPSDPVPHALVTTGIVVVVSTTAVALALIRSLHDEKTDD